MKYKVQFYARMRDEVIERIVDAPNEGALEFAVKYYGSSKEDIRKIEAI